MKALYAIAIIGFFFVGGFFISRSSRPLPMQMASNEMPSPRRDPAAIKRVYDFSQLEGSALDFATKQRLLEGAKIIRDKTDVGVELGHFVIKDSGGQKVFACQHYSRVVLSFQGEGMAVGGELPKMEVEGNCEISPDINSIAAVWIPVSRILGEPVADGEFDFREGHPAKLKFANVSDQWPKTWQLKTVRLIDSTGKNSEVSIDSAELKKILHEPFLLQF